MGDDSLPYPFNSEKKNPAGSPGKLDPNAIFLVQERGMLIMCNVPHP